MSNSSKRRSKADHFRILRTGTHRKAREGRKVEEKLFARARKLNQTVTVFRGFHRSG
jgi:hypothetical protein